MTATEPTAENTRECGADGDLPGFRNWQNDAHVADLARVWNVEPETIPHYAPPTHAMQMMRYVENGSIRLLWVSGTNPAVSLPDSTFVKRMLEKLEFYVAIDFFLNDTARHADIVLPGSLQEEDEGTVTQVEGRIIKINNVVDMICYHFQC